MTRMDLDLREEAKFDLERRRARTEASEGEQPGQDDGCGGEGVECFPEPSTGHVVAERLVKTRGSELGIGILERDIRNDGDAPLRAKSSRGSTEGCVCGGVWCNPSPREEVPSALTKGRGGLDLYLGHLMTPTKPNRPRHKPSWTPHIRSGAKGAAGRVCVCGGGRGERRTDHLHLAGKVS